MITIQSTLAPDSAGTQVDNLALSSNTLPFAGVFSFEPDFNNNDDLVSFTPLAPAPPLVDLVLTKTGPPAPVPAGTNATFRLTVRNGGPQDAAAVQIGDTLPDGARVRRRKRRLHGRRTGRHLCGRRPGRRREPRPGDHGPAVGRPHRTDPHQHRHGRLGHNRPGHGEQRRLRSAYDRGASVAAYAHGSSASSAATAATTCRRRSPPPPPSATCLAATAATGQAATRGAPPMCGPGRDARRNPGARSPARHARTGCHRSPRRQRRRARHFQVTTSCAPARARTGCTAGPATTGSSAAPVQTCSWAAAETTGSSAAAPRRALKAREPAEARTTRSSAERARTRSPAAAAPDRITGGPRPGPRHRWARHATAVVRRANAKAA